MNSATFVLFINDVVDIFDLSLFELDISLILIYEFFLYKFAIQNIKLKRL